MNEQVTNGQMNGNGGGGPKVLLCKFMKKTKKYCPHQYE
jgi:hypothetical protein